MKSLATAILGLLMLAGAGPSSAAELLMLHQPGCAWCQRFEAEIGQSYPKTGEGKVAPLRRIDITQDWPDDLDNVAKERFTPTFILMDQGKEIARMRGYGGDQFFWFLLDEMIARLPVTPVTAAIPAG